MSFEVLIRRMVTAVEDGNGRGVADCFTPDGVYHDVFYGSFEGDRIVDMIDNYFHRDGGEFRWDIHDAVEAGDVGYARYVFSYKPKLEGAGDQRVVFEGVAICRLRDGLIADYREVANAAVGLQAMGFAPERLAKFLAKQGKELRARSEAARHIA